MALAVGVNVSAVTPSDTFNWDQAIQFWLLGIYGHAPRANLPPAPDQGGGADGTRLHDRSRRRVCGLDKLDLEPSDPRFLRVIDLSGSFGLGDVQAVSAAIYAAKFVGALMLGLIGWVLLRGLGSLYRVRWISDQSIIIELDMALVRTHASDGLRLLHPFLVPGPLRRIRGLQDRRALGFRPVT